MPPVKLSRLRPPNEQGSADPDEFDDIEISLELLQRLHAAVVAHPGLTLETAVNAAISSFVETAELISPAKTAPC